MDRKTIFLLTVLILAMIALVFYIIIRGSYFAIVPDVAIKSVSVPRNEVFVGDVVNITVTAKNEGNTIETFNVTTYYNLTALETQKVSDLDAGAQKILTFRWDTKDVSPSNYVIKVEASVVSGETHTLDNAYANTVVRVNRRTLVSIYPSESEVAVGQNLTVNVTISNVANLYGFAFELRYNTTMLQALDVVEGDFLKSGGSGTFFFPEINGTEGYVYAESTRLGRVPGADGNGTLASITFKVINQGTSILDLSSTQLRDNEPRAIPHIAVDGSVKV